MDITYHFTGKYFFVTYVVIFITDIKQNNFSRITNEKLTYTFYIPSGFLKTYNYNKFGLRNVKEVINGIPKHPVFVLCILPHIVLSMI